MLITIYKNSFSLIR